MITRADLAKGLLGAALFARGDPRGLLLFGNDAGEAKRSFWAALIALPFFVPLLLLDYLQRPAPPDGATFLLVQASAYVIGWTAFPLIMVGVSQAFAREAVWCRYVAAYNWANLITINLSLFASAIHASHLLSPGATGFVHLLVMLIIGAYEWFIARIMLALSGPRALMVVALDFLLGIAITGTAEKLLR
jgi:hypothetical protein